MHSYPLQGYIIILSRVSTDTGSNSTLVTFETENNDDITRTKPYEGVGYNDRLAG